MSVLKRVAAVLVALVAFSGAGVAVAGSAGAVPYPNPPQITCKITVTPPKFTVTCTLTGYLPRHFIDVVLHSQPVDLGTVRVNKNGAGAVSNTVNKSFAGQAHTVIGTDTTVGTDVAQTKVVFPVSAAAVAHSGTAGIATSLPDAIRAHTVSSDSSTSLSSTGVAVLSIGGAGALLLVAGGVLLLTGRRRRSLG